MRKDGQNKGQKNKGQKKTKTQKRGQKMTQDGTVIIYN